MKRTNNGDDWDSLEMSKYPNQKSFLAYNLDRGDLPPKDEPIKDPNCITRFSALLLFEISQAQVFVDRADTLKSQNFDMNELMTPLGKQVTPNNSSQIQIKKEKEITYYTPTSLNMFQLGSPIRSFCISIKEKQLFNYLIIGVIIINSVMLAFIDYQDPEADTLGNNIAIFSEPIFTAIYTFEATVRIIAMGFLFDKNCYLRDAWNWLDLIVVVSAIIDQIPGINGFSGIKAFRLFRPLKNLYVIETMKILMNTLLNSIVQFINILIVSFFLFGVFAIIGVNLFSGLQHNRCRLTPEPVDGDWIADPTDLKACGGFHSCKVACGSLYDYNRTILYKVEDFNRDSEIASLNYGITNFDYIWTAILTVFQCTTLEGWTDIMYIFGDSFNYLFTAFYLSLCILVCSYFMLNLIVAVMLDNFQNMQNTQDKIQAIYEQAFDTKHIDFEAKRKELKEYAPSIKGAHLPTKKFSLRQFLMKQYKTFIFDEISIPFDKYYDRKITQFFYKIVLGKWFNTLVFIIIVMSTVILCFNKYPDPDHYREDVILYMNYLVTVFFALEIVIKLIALGAKTYLWDINNLFDMTLVVLVCVCFILGQQYKAVGFAINASIKILMDSIYCTIPAIGNFTILMFLFIYVFSLLGMQFFAGSLKFDSSDKVDKVNGTSPRENFDTLLWAFVTVFSIIIGDGWNKVMYNCIRAVGMGATFYFIVLVLLGNIILLKLFLAILIGNFEEASILFKEMKFIKDQKNKIQLADAFGEQLNQEEEEVKPQKRFSGKTIKFDEQKKGTRMGNNKVVPKPPQKRNDLSEEEKSPPFKSNNRNNSQHVRKMSRASLVDSSYDSSYTNIDNNKHDMQLNQKIPPISHQVISESEKRKSVPQFKSRQTEENTKDLQIWQEESSDRRSRVRSLKLNRYVQVLKKQRELKRAGRSRSINIAIEDLEGQKVAEGEIKPAYFKNPTVLFSSKRNAVEPIQLKHGFTQMRMHPSETQNELNSKNMELAEDLGNNSKIVGLEKRESMKSFVKSSQVYQSKGKFYKVIHYLQRSSLCILHKKNCLRMFLIKMVIPIKQKQQKQIISGKNLGINLRKQREDEIFKQMLESDGSNSQEESQSDECPDILSKESENEESAGQSKDQDGIVEKNALPSQQSDRPFVDNISLGLLKHKTLRKTMMKKLTLKHNLRQAGERCSCIFQASKLNKYFENIVLTLILTSSFILILDNPLNDPDSKYTQVIKLINVVFTFLFLIEALIKIFALGLFRSSLRGQQPYMMVAWNLLDLLVVLTSIIDFSYSPVVSFTASESQEAQGQQQLQSLKALRALRALRPLRVISVNEELKVVVNAVFSSLYALINVMFICFLFVLIFAIMGVNFFKGKFFSCDMNFLSTIGEQRALNLIETKFDCFNMGGTWINSNTNFDNTPQAILTLFQLITREGWLQVSYLGVDSTQIDFQPKVNHQQGWVFYFIFFIIIGNFLIINLFVGVVITNFNRMRDKLRGYAIMTEKQRHWVEMQRFMIRQKLKIKDKAPTQIIRKALYKIVTQSWFDMVIMGLIIMNTIFMAIRYFNMPQDYAYNLEQANTVFVIIFNIEAIMKITALGRIYFHAYGNIFDFLVVVGANTGIFFKIFTTNHNIITAATIVRSFRIIRIFKIISSSNHLKVIIATFLNILPSLINVVSLLFLLLLIYAVLGMNLFASVKFHGGINEEVNFRSFGLSLMLLMRCATGENWSQLMNNFAFPHEGSYEGCMGEQSYDSQQKLGIQGCGTKIAYIYFISFIITLQLVTINLFVAVVIEGFTSAKNQNTGCVTSEHYQRMIEVWSYFDHSAKGWISVQDFIFFMYTLDFPLGRKNDYEEQLKQKVQEDTDNQRLSQFDYRFKYIWDIDRNMIVPQLAALKLMKEIKIPVYKNHQIHFKDVIIRLTRDVMLKNTNENEFEQINEFQKQRLQRDWIMKFKQLKKIHEIEINISNDVPKFSTLNTGMYWSGLFILKMLKVKMESKRQKSNNKYISQAIRKSAYTQQKQQEISKKIELEDKDKYSQQRSQDEARNLGENQDEIEDAKDASPMGQESKSDFPAGHKQKDQRQKDTERSTWWLSASTRMDRWLINQEQRQGKKKIKQRKEDFRKRITSVKKDNVGSFQPYNAFLEEKRESEQPPKLLLTHNEAESTQKPDLFDVISHEDSSLSAKSKESSVDETND